MKLFGRHLYRTMFGLAQVIDLDEHVGSPLRVLKLGGVYQSATYIDERRFEPVFAYYRAFDTVLQYPNTLLARNGSADATTAHRAPQRVLVLGGGGYAWPKHVLATHPDARLDVVEIDPAITRIAREHFFLDEAIERFDPAHERLNLICADGRALLDDIAEGLDRSYGAQPHAHYDAIVNDAFSGSEPVHSLATVEAAQAAKACLAPDGLYAANVVSDFDRSNVAFLRDLAAALLEAFDHVHVIPCPDEDYGGEDNYLVIATDSNRQFADAVPFDEDFLGTPLHDGHLRA